MKARKIIVACDSYKGCMASKDINKAVSESLTALLGNDVECISIEMSDGGEGMLDAFLHAMHGQRHTARVHDALMRPIEAHYGVASDTAIIETAQAAGLELIEPARRNPLHATSWGVGELIQDAYQQGLRKFVIGLGGSATSDCGIGMLKAMEKQWRKIRQDCSFVLASDVTNPLYGPHGAAYVFASQKGADDTMKEVLDRRAMRFAKACNRHFGKDESMTPGAGAAGGLGYAFLQFFNATFHPGAELLLSHIKFDSLLQDASLVITGEGHSDEQTLMGKLPQRILHHAQRCQVPVWLLSGGVNNVSSLLAAGFAKVLAITPLGMPLHEAMQPDVARENIKRNVSVALSASYRAGNLL